MSADDTTVQRDGPHFVFRDDGIITFGPPDALDRQGNDIARLTELHPILRALSAELVDKLGESNIPHWYLRDCAKAYQVLLDQDLECVSFPLLYVEGVRLANAYRAYYGGFSNELSPLQPSVRGAIETLLDVHGTFILSTAVGHELIAREERYRRTPSEEAEYRAAAIDLAQHLQNDPEVIDPEVASFMLESIEEIGNGANPERSSIVAIGVVKNVVAALTTALRNGVFSANSAPGLVERIDNLQRLTNGRNDLRLEDREIALINRSMAVGQVRHFGGIGLSISFLGFIIGSFLAGPITRVLLPIGLAFLWIAQHRLSRIKSRQPANGA